MKKYTVFLFTVSLSFGLAFSTEHQKATFRTSTLQTSKNINFNKKWLCFRDAVPKIHLTSSEDNTIHLQVSCTDSSPAPMGGGMVVTAFYQNYLKGKAKVHGEKLHIDFFNTNKQAEILTPKKKSRRMRDGLPEIFKQLRSINISQDENHWADIELWFDYGGSDIVFTGKFNSPYQDRELIEWIDSTIENYQLMLR